MARIPLFEKKLSFFKAIAIFSIISFKIGFFSIVKYCSFPVFWFRTSCMGYVKGQSAKDMARISSFEKKLSLFKEVAVFSIISFKFFFGILKYCYFPVFLVQNQFYGLCELRICKKMARIPLFEKKLSFFKAIAIFSIISFKIGFISIVKYCSFPVFWFRTSCMCYVKCQSAKENAGIRLFEKKIVII